MGGVGEIGGRGGNLADFRTKKSSSSIKQYVMAEFELRIFKVSIGNDFSVCRLEMEKVEGKKKPKNVLASRQLSIRL